MSLRKEKKASVFRSSSNSFFDCFSHLPIPEPISMDSGMGYAVGHKPNRTRALEFDMIDHHILEFDLALRNQKTKYCAWWHFALKLPQPILKNSYLLTLKTTQWVIKIPLFPLILCLCEGYQFNTGLTLYAHSCLRKESFSTSQENQIKSKAERKQKPFKTV